MRSKPMWDRIPTSTEKLQKLRELLLLLAMKSLFGDAVLKSGRKYFGRSESLKRRLAKIAINQVRNKPPARSSVKIPMRAWPYHCWKYPLIGKLKILSVISGIAAPTDKASASRESGQRRTAGRISP